MIMTLIVVLTNSEYMVFSFFQIVSVVLTRSIVNDRIHLFPSGHKWDIATGSHDFDIICSQNIYV